MESCIRIGHDTETGEYYIEAYGTKSQHLGSRHFKKWAEVCCFLGGDAGVSAWLTKIAGEGTTNEKAEKEVASWPANTAVAEPINDQTYYIDFRDCRQSEDSWYSGPAVLLYKWHHDFGEGEPHYLFRLPNGESWVFPASSIVGQQG